MLKRKRSDAEDRITAIYNHLSIEIRELRNQIAVIEFKNAEKLAQNDEPQVFAAQVKATYDACIEQGFTEEQAFELVKSIIVPHK